MRSKRGRFLFLPFSTLFCTAFAALYTIGLPMIIGHYVNVTPSLQFSLLSFNPSCMYLNPLYLSAIANYLSGCQWLRFVLLCLL